MISMHGVAGREWLSGLPELIRDLSRMWSLDVSEPFADLTYNYVAPCVREDGTPAVLKVGFPEPENRREATALDAFGGDGMVRLLDSDTDLGALLIERVLPGDSLVRMQDDARATRILAETMIRIRTDVPADHDFPSVGHWERGFARLRERNGGGTGPLPPDLVEEAEGLFGRLLTTTGQEYLLHGDLHHDNVLDAGKGSWLAIDPKGVIGDGAYEPAAMLHNPAGFAGRPDLRPALERCLDVLADTTGYDRERILLWATAQAVLSAVWTVEDHGEVPEETLVFARTLSDMRS